MASDDPSADEPSWLDEYEEGDSADERWQEELLQTERYLEQCDHVLDPTEEGDTTVDIDAVSIALPASPEPFSTRATSSEESPTAPSTTENILDERVALQQFLYEECQLWSFDRSEEEFFYPTLHPSVTSVLQKSPQPKWTHSVFLTLILFICLFGIFSGGSSVGKWLGTLVSGGVVLGFYWYRQPKGNTMVDAGQSIKTLYADAEQFQTLFMDLHREISQCFSLIQEMQLVDQGYRSSRHLLGGPITRLELQTKRRRGQKIREGLKSIMMTMTTELVQGRSLFFESCLQHEFARCQQFSSQLPRLLEQWHAERTLVHDDIAKNPLLTFRHDNTEQHNLALLKEQRTAMSSACSEWTLVFAFFVGLSVFPDNHWAVPSGPQVECRVQSYQFLSSLFHQWNSIIADGISDLRRIRHSSHTPKVPPSISKPRSGPDTSSGVTQDRQQRKRAIVQRFLLISRELRNHMSTIDTSLLLFEQDLASTTDALEESADEDNQIQIENLLSAFNQVRGQLVRAQEKWELGNQHLVNYFASVRSSSSLDPEPTSTSTEWEFNPMSSSEPASSTSPSEPGLLQVFEGYTGPPSDDEGEATVDLPSMVPTLLHELFPVDETIQSRQDRHPTPIHSPFAFPIPMRPRGEEVIFSSSHQAKEEEEEDNPLVPLGDVMNELQNVLKQNMTGHQTK